MYSCEVCKKCEVPCPYGGPYILAPDRPIDVAMYTMIHYGVAFNKWDDMFRLLSSK